MTAYARATPRIEADEAPEATGSRARLLRQLARVDAAKPLLFDMRHATSADKREEARDISRRYDGLFVSGHFVARWPRLYYH